MLLCSTCPCMHIHVSWSTILPLTRNISAISTASEGECLLNQIAVKYVCRWCDKAYYAHVVASMES